MPRILVVAPNWIGDALMAQPLLARLREKNPGVQLDVLVPDWVAPVVRRMPEVDEVLVAPFRHGALQLGKRWRFGRALAGRYERALVLPNTWKSALTPFFAGIPRRDGYLGETRYGLLNTRHRKSAAPMRLHYARLSELPGVEPAQPLPQTRLVVSPPEIHAVRRKFGLEAPYAAYCPGAEFGPAKRWPYFAQLAQKSRLPVVLLGSAGDRAAAYGIDGRNLAGETSLDEAVVILAGAAHAVCNDSGLMHIAAALGRPQVALFGSSSPRHTPPAPPAARVLWLGIDCSPCYQRNCPLGHFRCMRELSVERVLAELELL